MPLPTAYGTIPLGGALPEAYIPVDSIPLLGGALESGYGEVSYAVNMTAAASGSNGITVADDSDLDFGAGDFSIVCNFALTDWTPSANVYLYYHYLDSNNRVGFYVNTTGNLVLFVVIGGVRLFAETTATTISTSTAAISVLDSRIAQICISVARETAGSSGSITYSVNDSQLGSAIAIAPASPASLSIAGNVNILTNNVVTARIASTWFSTYLYNRALSAADVLSLYRNGPASIDVGTAGQIPSQTAATSGTLVVGRRYRIRLYNAGDDFTNVGAASNATGVEFVATGTTPTTWANSSQLVLLGITLRLDQTGITTGSGLTILDTSGNGNNATMPASGATKVTIRR